MSYKQLHGLELEVHCTPVGQVGDNLTLYIQLRQQQPQIRYLLITVGEQQLKICLNQLRHQQRLYFTPTQRGKFDYPHLKISSIFPFGLVQAWSYIFFQQQLYSWVAPVAHFYANSNQHLQQDIGFDEFQDLKSYQMGDSLNHVAWKQVARGQGMYIKQFEPHQSLHEINIDYAKMPASSHEEKLSLMMGLVEQCEQQQQPYRLQLPQKKLGVAVGAMQLQQAKRLLAEA